MHKGRELDDDKTLAEQGIDKEGAEIITVRKVLVAEGWKIVQDDDEEDREARQGRQGLSLIHI